MRYFKTYTEAKAAAEKLAADTGLPVGIEKFEQINGYPYEPWQVGFLPDKDHRFGRDARCEVVEPPGHPRRPTGRV